MIREQGFKKQTLALLIGAAFATVGGAQVNSGPASDVAGPQSQLTPERQQADAAARAARRAAVQDRAGRVTAAARRAAIAKDAAPAAAPVPPRAPRAAPAAPMAVTAGQTPRYFSHPNYANSPLPGTAVTITSTNGLGTGAAAAATVDPTTGAITAIKITNPGSGYQGGATVAIESLVGAGSGATAVATVDATTGAITAITLQNSGNGYTAGGIRKFVDGLPGLAPTGANNLGQYLPVAAPDTTTYPGSDYYEIGLVQYREKMHSDLPGTLLRGYVQLSTGAVPGKRVQLTNANKNGTTTAIPNRFGVDKPHYLGPVIVAQKDRPVRVKFVNLLPTGQGGNLFIPVDTTVMGAGMGPTMAGMTEPDPQNPMCGATPKPYGCYTENRATLHLHGGVSPWISDGTPHQWITPAGENTPYPQGVSVVPVPDMNDNGNPTDGSMTFYWTNQQGARLMFYHDHAWGITRLNVYAGEAAGYLIQDPKEAELVTRGLLPADQIPLVIQEKTFVPTPAQLAVSDETWDSNRWGGLGQLWMPHVYSPAQNPGSMTGVNDYGRWAYGPWFWPPTQDVANGPIANPYYDPTCNPDAINGPACEPPLIPGTPNVSMGMEAFLDTPLVNGTAYPTLTVQPKAYRLRILSAANDRVMNLSLYKARDAAGRLCDTLNPAPAAESTGVACTEVALNPLELAAALIDPTVFPTPVVGTEGPSWIQVGTEGGFLPAPVVIPPQPTTWVVDPTVFNAGNVDQHSLLLAPAERADVVVDFSAYAGQTLILYNDAPAAFPARDPRYDYYTGNSDLRATGGAPPTQPGYGPNSRTVMQIKVAAAPAAPAFNLAGLQAAFAHQPDGSGVFESSQNPIIVGQRGNDPAYLQGIYNFAYGTNFTGLDGLAQIFSTSLTFKSLATNAAGAPISITLPLAPKMIQDEMGEAFEHSYGRMSGNLGVETPVARAGLQNMILYPYSHPPSEVMKGLELPAGVAVAPIAAADDGTQLWKITHNGVDTHPIHFHLYDVQLINRVGWDGIIRKPDANELGWKDTVRISPLEDTIVAVRPIMPRVPFDMPNSVRLLDPSMPEGAVLANSTAQDLAGKPMFAFAPNGEPIDIVNHYVNFGYEYVWHCHILSHEEMDMMRSQVVGVKPKAPSSLAASTAGSTVTLRWTDQSANETGFVVERATDAGFTTGLTSFNVAANVTSYADKVDISGAYSYRVMARNLVGDTFDYTNPALNEGATFPTMAMDSAYSNAVRATVQSGTIAAPTNLTATYANPRVTLNWGDASVNETGYVVKRAPVTVNGMTGALTVGAYANLPTAAAVLPPDLATYADVNVPANTLYSYQVGAMSGASAGPVSQVYIASATAPAAPGTLLVGNATRTSLRLSWPASTSTFVTGYEIQRCRGSAAQCSGANAAWTTVATRMGRSTASYTDTGLASLTSYQYRIRSVVSALPGFVSAPWRTRGGTTR